jgi:glycerol-3-phosphate dehydrogenase
VSYANRYEDGHPGFDHNERAMQRDLARLAETKFDLLVIGAGIHGACAAWDATLRGLSVALVDQADFGAATSASSLGIVHGGLRYLGRGDLPRTRQSIRERTALLRIAPSLIEPLAVLVPTFGRGPRSRTAFRAALALNDLLSAFRNRPLAADRRIPRGRVLSRAEYLTLFPWLTDESQVTGGALWYDARLLHPERLTLSFVRSAADRGAAVANYLPVESVRVENQAAVGARVRDQLSGDSFDIQARAVMVAAGHWTYDLVRKTVPGSAEQRRSHALGVNVVLGRRLVDLAVGVPIRSEFERDPIGGGKRYLFLVPGKQTTTIGTWYGLADRSHSRTLSERGASELMRELEEACPGLDVDSDDIVRWHSGWLPLAAGTPPGTPGPLAERPWVVDHGRIHGIHHLFSVEGVKYTTARAVAEQAIDAVFVDLGRQSPACRTGDTPLITGSSPIRPDLAHAVRQEMAVKLSDLVFRRTDLGAPPGPNRAMVQGAARVMGEELGWDPRRQQSEVDEVMRQTQISAGTLEAVG